MQAQCHDDVNDLRKLYDKLNLTGRVIRVGQHAIAGGCAYIWEAKLIPLRTKGKVQDGDGEKVAVKVIREVGSSSEMSLRKRLIREVRAWSVLHHRNVLPLYGFTSGFNPGSKLASLVCPWMPNGTARRYLERRSVSERIRVLTGVADGLCYLHRHDVVHGDLKGENIMIDRNYEPRIADFGLSKLLDEVSSTVTVTFTGEPFGSVRWIAPEILFNPGFNFESDIWSFGMTVLELFTNAPPYYHLKRDPQVIVALHNRQLPPLPSPAFGMDDVLWELCCECWKSDPRLRPSSRVIAKRLWDLDLKCKLMMRKKRRAPPSPDRRRDITTIRIDVDTDESIKSNGREEGEGRVRKSPKLATLEELARDSLPSPSPTGTSIPIQTSLARRSGTPRTPRTPTSRSASGAHSRASSFSSSRSRRSSRGDLSGEIDPRRLITNAHSDSDIFAALQHHPFPIRRSQTEPTGLELFVGDQMPENHMAVSTPRHSVPVRQFEPLASWNNYQDAYMDADAYNVLGNTTATADTAGYATPPIGYSAAPALYAIPPIGYAGGAVAYSGPGTYGTPVFATPPGNHAHLYSQHDMYHQQQTPPLVPCNTNDLDLIQQSQYLGGFDADMIHPSQWASYPSYTDAALVTSLPRQNGNGNGAGSLLFDNSFGFEGHGHPYAYEQSSPYLLPPTEGDSFGSPSYSPYSSSPSFQENALPSPHMLGQLFSENFQYEAPHLHDAPAHMSAPLFHQPLHASPQTLLQDFPQQQQEYQGQSKHPYHVQQTQQLPSSKSGTVDFASLQNGIISPAMSDISAPTPSIEDTPLIGGFEDAFAFDSEDDGEELDGSLALIGGLDVSGDFVASVTHREGAGVQIGPDEEDENQVDDESEEESDEDTESDDDEDYEDEDEVDEEYEEEDEDEEETPHGSPQQLEFIAPLGRNQSPHQTPSVAGQPNALGLGVQMPTPAMSPLLSKFKHSDSGIS